MASRSRLFERFIEGLPAGELEWIGLRSSRRGAVAVVDSAMALQGVGLEGDRRCEGRVGSARQVTLISREYMGQIAHFLGRDMILPELLRRNLVVSGINLMALRYQHFRIGEAVFETTALCHPCSRMEEVLGPGAVAAMLGHGGLCARIVTSGRITCGDAVVKL